MTLAIVIDYSSKTPSEILFNLSQIITAITIIGGFLITMVQSFTKYNPLNGIRKWLAEPFKKEMVELKQEVKQDISVLRQELNDVVIAKMKSDIMNDSLPLSERVKIVDKYIEAGYNGEIKSYGKVLKEEYEKKIKERICDEH